MCLLSFGELPPPPPGKSGWPWRGESERFPGTLPHGRNRPLISIVTPSFNQAQYLESTIRSVLLQGYPHLEYLILDGGSTDGSVDIIRKYEPWLAYWASEKDEGQAHAINKGFARASGDIFGWLNSDDQYCRDVLPRVAEIFIENPELDLVYGDCEMIDGADQVIDAIRSRPGDLADLLARDFIPQPSAFFRRRAWKAAGGLDNGLRCILDFDLWIRMMMKGIQARYVPAVLSRFRWHGVSKSNREVLQFGFEYLSLLERLFEGTVDAELRRARLGGYHHAFSIMASGYERLLQEGENKEQQVLETLGQWKAHLRENQEEYEKIPALKAKSLYRIGQSYCMQGFRNEGRRAFAAALRVRKSEYRAFFGWLAASLGTTVYHCYTSAWRALFDLTRHLRRRFHRKELRW